MTVLRQVICGTVMFLIIEMMRDAVVWQTSMCWRKGGWILVHSQQTQNICLIFIQS